MLTVEGWMTIRVLHAQSKSIKAIATELGVARNTVCLALRRDGPPKYQGPPRPNPKREPFVDEVERMVVVDRFIGSLIVRELKAHGNAGGATALYPYLRASARPTTPTSGRAGGSRRRRASRAEFDRSMTSRTTPTTC
jgi:transposase